MYAENRAEFKDFEDFLFGGARGESGCGVGADSWEEERCAGCLDGEENEFLDLGWQPFIVDGDGAKFQVI